jgi:hypothetical protein
MLAGAVVVDVLQLAADHVGDQPLARHRGHHVVRDDLAAVAEDGAGIAQLVQLLQPVRDVDQRAALGAQALDQAEQDLGLAVRQAAGRLVEGDDLGVLHDGLADLDHLALRDGQLGQARGRVQLHADGGQLLGHQPARGLVVDQAQARRQAAQQHVLGDGQLGDVLQLLVDDGHAGRDGVAGRREVALLAVDEQPAAVGLVLAAEDLQQRALAGAVLAEQAHDLARPRLEADPVQRLDAGEHLADVVELQGRHVSDSFGLLHGPSAGPLPSRPALAMCLPVDPASIAVPSGGRPGLPAFSGARLDEGLHLTSPSAF